MVQPAPALNDAPPTGTCPGPHPEPSASTVRVVGSTGSSACANDPQAGVGAGVTGAAVGCGVADGVGVALAVGEGVGVGELVPAVN